MIESVVEALARVPEDAWPREALGEVAASLRDYVQTLPVDRLSHTSVQGVFKLGRRLIDRMPATAAASLSEEFAAANITVLALRPVPHKMLFDRTEFTVAAGRPVEIFFENSDIMPHNVVLTAPGRMEAVGRAADAMQTDPDAQARGYVPLRDDVLFATDLLNPGDSARLAFIAPSTPGDYPFVCTYPGHWITMNGVLRVVEPDDRALLASKPDAPSSASIERPQRSFVRFWSFVRGQAMFTAAGCIECHRIRGAGTAIGPDLDGIGEKYSALGLLEHILEPSNAIAEEYRAYMVDTASGWYSGIIVDQTPERVRMRANPRDPDDVLDLPRRDIRAIDESPISTMPQDLLITLDREEILDLIAYLRAGGNPDDPAFAR